MKVHYTQVTNTSLGKTNYCDVYSIRIMWIFLESSNTCENSFAIVWYWNHLEESEPKISDLKFTCTCADKLS